MSSSIGPLSTKFSEIRIKIQDFGFMKMHLKMSSAKRRPFCPSEGDHDPERLVTSGPVRSPKCHQGWSASGMKTGHWLVPQLSQTVIFEMVRWVWTQPISPTTALGKGKLMALDRNESTIFDIGSAFCNAPIRFLLWNEFYSGGGGCVIYRNWNEKC